MTDVEILKRLALFGSPTARVAALTLLDELSGGELLKELEKLVKAGVYNEKSNFPS